MYFDDDQKPVPVTWPGENADPVQVLIDALNDAGCTIPDSKRGEALHLIEKCLDVEGDTRAALALCHLLKRLPGGRRGAELRCALLSAEESYAAEARAIGMPANGFHRAVCNLRRFLKLQKKT